MCLACFVLVLSRGAVEALMGTRLGMFARFTVDTLGIADSTGVLSGRARFTALCSNNIMGFTVGALQAFRRAISGGVGAGLAGDTAFSI